MKNYPSSPHKTVKFSSDSPNLSLFVVVVMQYSLMSLVQKHFGLIDITNQRLYLVTLMVVTKCVGDNSKMLVMAMFVTNIHYLFTLALDTNIQKMSPKSKFCHQHSKIFAKLKSPTVELQ